MPAVLLRCVHERRRRQMKDELGGCRHSPCWWNKSKRKERWRRSHSCIFSTAFWPVQWGHGVLTVHFTACGTPLSTSEKQNFPHHPRPRWHVVHTSLYKDRLCSVRQEPNRSRGNPGSACIEFFSCDLWAYSLKFNFFSGFLKRLSGFTVAFFFNFWLYISANNKCICFCVHLLNWTLGERVGQKTVVTLSLEGFNFPTWPT